MTKIIPTLLALIFIFSACSTPDLPPSTPRVAVISSPTFPPPTETATAETPATAIPLNVADKVKELLTAQSAPFTVNAEGKAVINLKDTVSIIEQIVLEQIGHTPTDDGLAKDILSGIDKAGTRYIFAENYGWVKDIESGTPEKPTEIPFEYVETGVLNTIAALHYQEKPTMPEGAKDPQYWLYGGGIKSMGYYSEVLTLMPLDGNVVEYKKSELPFGDPTLWVRTTKNGKGIIVAVQARKNPVPGQTDSKRKTNWNLAFDEDKFREDLMFYISQDKNRSFNIINFLLNDKSNFEVIFAPPLPYKWEPNFYVDSRGSDGIYTVGSLQKRDEMLSLFPKDVQDQIKKIIDNIDQGLLPDMATEAGDVKLKEIPPEIALKYLAARPIGWTWGGIKP